MSLEDLIQRYQHGKIIPKKMPFSQEVKRSIYLLVFTLLGLIVLLSIVFLLNSSQFTQKGYIFKEEQALKEQFLLKNRELINKIIEAQSSKTIESSQTIKGMHKPENPIYVEPKK